MLPQTLVEVEDFRRAQPDAIAHSAPKIISRLKSGGEKTTQALKSLCWRSKGLQVEVTCFLLYPFVFKYCKRLLIELARFVGQAGWVDMQINIL